MCKNVDESFEICFKKIREIFELSALKSIKILIISGMLNKMVKNNLIQTLERKEKIFNLLEELEIITYDDVKECLENIP